VKTIVYNHQLEYFSSALFENYFSGMRLGVFDIETLGLNASQCQVVLAGIMEVGPDGSAVQTQYFIESLEEEPLLLSVLEEELNKFDVILTYNGRHFDVPFITKRGQALCSPDYRICPYNLDLYLIINGHCDFKHYLPNLRQCSVEEYMGVALSRADEISGKESIQLYYDYLECAVPEQKQALESKILLHNHDDLVQLYRIMPAVQQTNLHSAMNALGFPVKGRCGWPDLFARTIRVSPKELTVSGEYCGHGINYTSYSSHEQPYQCTFVSDGTFAFSFPAENIKGSRIINARMFLDDTSPLEHLGGYVNGFLILEEKNKRNFSEINTITKKLLEHFMEITPV